MTRSQVVLGENAKLFNNKFFICDQNFSTSNPTVLMLSIPINEKLTEKNLYKQAKQYSRQMSAKTVAAFPRKHIRVARSLVIYFVYETTCVV